MANIRIIEKHEELNSIGCEFFTKASENHITRMSSTKLRWLSIRDGKGDYISTMQEMACKFVENIAEKYGTHDWNKLNLKILLYENPRKNQDIYIKYLLKCGADLRYLKTKDCTKVVIQDNVLYLTFASSFEKVVNSGIYYVGKKLSDPYIDYCLNQFDTKFSKARKMTIRNDKIEYADGFVSRLKNEFKTVVMKDWIILLLGALFGGVVGVLISYIAKLFF